MKLLSVVLGLVFVSVLCEGKPSNFIESGTTGTANWVCYVVSRRNESQPSSGFLFSGTLFTNRHVLTVAHAINGYYRWSVGYGSPNVASLLFIESSFAVAHQNFNSVNLNDNIGIIFLSEETVFTPPVILPAATFIDPNIGIINGFGMSNSANSVLPDVLQTGLIAIISNAVCSETFGTQIVTTGTVCGTSIQGHLCHGDQGGPLVDITGGIVFGIASFWISSCNSGLPMGFIRITHYLNWINETLGQEIP